MILKFYLDQRLLQEDKRLQLIKKRLFDLEIEHYFILMLFYDKVHANDDF